MEVVSVFEAVKLLQAGAIIAYPTESMYGLGCDPRQYTAVQALLHLKRRSESKGLLLVAGEFAQLSPYIALDQVSAAQWERVWAHWPGFRTYIFPAAIEAPTWITGGKPGIALRLSQHSVITQLSQAFGHPIVSTSANYTSQPPIVDLQELQHVFPEIAGVVAGEMGAYRQASTIEDVLTGQIFRAGE